MARKTLSDSFILLEIAKLLIEHGADISLQNKEGTVLNIAKRYGYSDLVTVIEQEQKRVELMNKKQVLQEQRLLAYLQRNNLDNLSFVLPMCLKIENK